MFATTARRYLEVAVCLSFGLATVESLRAEVPPGRYVVDEATVRDTKTGLVWQRNVDAASTRVAASTYCEQLTVAGGGWRAPNIKELLTLVDPSRYDPAMDPTAFPQAEQECCRSAQSYVTQPPFSQTTPMGVYMKGGNSGSLEITALVRCVR